ncbi:MAG TPA: hypothetical protein VKG66_00125 [Steroidobacteraceae bacterium]|nr:hypothetical protein [Steroidobacteraceae bacterium]
MLRRHFTWPLCIAFLAGIAACADLQWRDDAPVRVNQPEPATPEALESECSRLRAEIRRNQVTAQEAPSTTSTPIIADASIGKADRNIDLLQKRYGDLDCASHPDQNQSTPAPGAPGALAPAPGPSGLP